MKISACYITKNEEKTLPRSIQSLIDSVDELIVTDTGSTDKTKEVALQFPKTQVFEIPWEDDFAKARNAALVRATGDWVVFLDADEYFTEDTQKNLRPVIEFYDAKPIDALLLLLVNLSEAGTAIDEPCVLRIFRRTEGVCYHGKIHEQLSTGEGQNLRLATVPSSQLLIHHTGYIESKQKLKGQRYLAMIQEAIQAGGDLNFYARYLAEAYNGLGDREKAIRYALLDIEKGPQRLFASHTYRIALGLMQAGAERDAVLDKAVQRFPQLPEFHAERAESLAGRLRFSEAVVELEKAFAALKNYQEDGESMNFPEEMQEMAWGRLTLFRKIVQREKDLRISACVIVRDEEKDLPRWLENAAAYADERIVMDTGSKDRTMEIARKAGARVYQTVWQDSFSLAKNTALEKATGDWITFLDADEYFQDAKTVRPYLAWLTLTHPKAEAVMPMMVNLDEDNHYHEIHRFPSIRLFKNDPAIRFGARVHENIYKSNEQLTIWKEGRHLRMFHLGYSSGRMKKKGNRNEMLLQKEIEEGKDPRMLATYLSDVYYGKGDYERALNYAADAIASPFVAVGSASDMYWRILECMRFLNMKAEDMLPVAETAIKKFPELPDFYSQKGQILSSMGKLREGEKNLLHALQIFETTKLVGGQSSSFVASLAVVWRRLGEIRLALGQKKEAVEALHEALQLNPYSQEALLAWKKLHMANLAESLRPFFKENEEDLRFLCRWATEVGELSLAYIYGKKLEALGVPLPEIHALQLATEKKWEEAAQESGQHITEYMLELTCSLLKEISHGSLWTPLKRTAAPLADEVVNVLRAYAGEGKLADTDTERNAYSSLILQLFPRLTLEEQARYAKLAEVYAPELQAKNARIMLDADASETALQVLESLPSDSQPRREGTYWRDMGEAKMHLGRYEEALGAFAKARALGYTGKDLEALETWVKEDLAQ